MNRRIRKKKLDAAHRFLANGVRLYATRPPAMRDAEKWEAVARKLLELSIALSLRERLQVLPGPRRGFELGPARRVAIHMPDRATLHASGLVLLHDRDGETERGTEEFRVTAAKEGGRWRVTRVLMHAVPRDQWDAAI